MERSRARTDAHGSKKQHDAESKHRAKNLSMGGHAIYRDGKLRFTRAATIADVVAMVPTLMAPARWHRRGSTGTIALPRLHCAVSASAGEGDKHG